MKDLKEVVLSELFVSCGVCSPNDLPVSGEQQREAMIRNYVNWFPHRSWSNLAAGLCEVGQVQLSKQVLSKYLLGMFTRKSLRLCFIITSHFHFQLFLGDAEIIGDPPIITEHPEAPNVIHGDMSLSLSVSATGDGTMSHHWIKDGVAFFDEMLPKCSGVNTPTLHITSFTDYHTGVYKCVVANPAGSVESKSVKLIGKNNTRYVVKKGPLGIYSLIPRPSPAFQYSPEKLEDLESNSM